MVDASICPEGCDATLQLALSANGRVVINHLGILDDDNRFLSRSDQTPQRCIHREACTRSSIPSPSAKTSKFSQEERGKTGDSDLHCAGLSLSFVFDFSSFGEPEIAKLLPGKSRARMVRCERNPSSRSDEETLLTYVIHTHEYDSVAHKYSPSFGRKLEVG